MKKSASERSTGNLPILLNAEIRKRENEFLSTFFAGPIGPIGLLVHDKYAPPASNQPARDSTPLLSPSFSALLFGARPLSFPCETISSSVMFYLHRARPQPGPSVRLWASSLYQ